MLPKLEAAQSPLWLVPGSVHANSAPHEALRIMHALLDHEADRAVAQVFHRKNVEMFEETCSGNQVQ